MPTARSVLTTVGISTFTSTPLPQADPHAAALAEEQCRELLRRRLAEEGTVRRVLAEELLSRSGLTVAEIDAVGGIDE